jgi:hypothetical protein
MIGRIVDKRPAVRQKRRSETLARVRKLPRIYTLNTLARVKCIENREITARELSIHSVKLEMIGL